MDSSCERLRGSQASLRPFLVAGLLIATASAGSEVVRFLVLTIGMICAFIAAFWELWRWAIDAPMPADVCSRCQRGLIARVAMSRHGERFYRCTICGARYRRTSRDGPWTDASGREHDAIYSRPEPGGLGKTLALPVEASIFWTGTVGVLLRNKRVRQRTQGAGCGGKFPRSSARTWLAQCPKDHGGLWDAELDG
jgi:uncharacterized C2H2 Zn-finger protein